VIVKRPPFIPAAFLIDFDGILVHSSEAHHQSYVQAFKPHGLTVTGAVSRLIQEGASRERVLAAAEVPPSLFRAVSRAKGDHYLEIIARGELALSEGSIPLLRKLRERVMKVALVSNSAAAKPAVQALGLTWAFDAVIDGSMIRRPKPNPEAYELAIEELSVPARRCIALEDSPLGAAAARSAGAWVAGIGPKLRSSQVDVLLPHLSALPLGEWLTDLPDPGGFS
jgi:beta-phosphoglucomutase